MLGGVVGYLNRLSLILLWIALPGCMQTRYVIQAGLGQAELWSLSRPIDEVLSDRDTDARTRVLLRESRVIMRYAEQHGFDSKGNYEHYVDVDRGQVVWFMAASAPLALEALVWNFPIVGSFPYLGWFDETEALQIRDRLKKRGLDVYLRPVHAYSTGGWLNDPILSTMLSPGDNAFRYLSNVLLHELTHANLLVDDQGTFNESLASFVGDTMAEEYLVWRFGEDSEQVVRYREEQAYGKVRGERFVAAHNELATLYDSDKSETEKLAEKERITKTLQIELQLSWQPNNASLLGFKVYNTGQSAFAAFYNACGSTWAPFFAIIKKLKASDFSAEQLEDIDPVIVTLAKQCSRTRS